MPNFDPGSIDPAFVLDKRWVRRAFARAAVDYDRVAVLQQEVCRRLLDRLEGIRTAPQVILDVGAGTGQAVRALVQRYPKGYVVALDLALPMLKRAGRMAPWRRRPARVCADAEALPLVAAGVDLIFSSLTVQWCNDLDSVFRGFERILRPRGLLLFSTLGPDTLQELRASWATVDDQPHVNAFMDMHDVGDALLRAGFADPVMDREMIQLTYRRPHDLMRDLKGLGAQNKLKARSKGLTGKGRMRRMLAHYETYRTREGVLPATFEVIYGHAWGPVQSRMWSGEVRIPVKRLLRQ